MVLGFEFRASCLLGRYSTTWVTLPDCLSAEWEQWCLSPWGCYED
jgi:hypothetical protein